MGFGDSPVTHPFTPQMEVGAWRGFGREIATSPYSTTKVACEATLGPILRPPLPHFMALYVASSHAASIPWANAYC